MVLTAADLPNLSTRLLLKGLRLFRVDESRFGNIIHEITGEEHKVNDEGEVIVPAWCLGGDFYTGQSTVTLAQLKTELATRPHVPNIPEGRAKRQAAAKMGRSKGRKDR